MSSVVLIFDCGATNIRVVAMDFKGNIKSSKSFSNESVLDSNNKNHRIWDIQDIWDKFCEASKYVCNQINREDIVGVAVTTFGVNGTLVNKQGNLLYPVISWQCERTVPIMNTISKYINIEDLYAESGVFPYHFNTIFSLLWIKENKTKLLEEAYRFLFMPSLFTYKMTGVMTNDATMVGTSMLTNIRTRKYSHKILEAIGIDDKLFGKTVEAGDFIGRISSEASEATGVPVGVPVFSAGHDTQFAIVGSGAVADEPVLSSGTWEILMTRSYNTTTTERQRNLGITTEYDAEQGMYNIGVNYIGSGILEWVKRNFYTIDSEGKIYETMISEAENIPPFCDGVEVNPNFYNIGSVAEGSIKGLNLHTTRAHIYRATLEALAFKLKRALEAIEKAGDFKAKSIICVGGGSKNQLWNQLRADICNVTIKTIDQKETTVLGAMMYVFKTVGNYENIEQVRKLIDYNIKEIKPSKTNKYQNYDRKINR